MNLKCKDCGRIMNASDVMQGASTCPWCNHDARPVPAANETHDADGRIRSQSLAIAIVCATLAIVAAWLGSFWLGLFVVVALVWEHNYRAAVKRDIEREKAEKIGTNLTAPEPLRGLSLQEALNAIAEQRDLRGEPMRIPIDMRHDPGLPTDSWQLRGKDGRVLFESNPRPLNLGIARAEGGGFLYNIGPLLDLTESGDPYGWAWFRVIPEPTYCPCHRAPWELCPGDDP